MALEKDRNILDTIVDKKIAAATEKGTFVSYSSSAGYVEAKANPSGVKFAGVTLHDVEDLYTAQDGMSGNISGENVSQITSRDVVDLGQVLSLARLGWVKTNMVIGSSPSAGDEAYLAASGNCSKTQATGAPLVGYFDDDGDGGYYKVVIVDRN